MYGKRFQPVYTMLVSRFARFRPEVRIESFLLMLADGAVSKTFLSVLEQPRGMCWLQE